MLKMFSGLFLAAIAFGQVQPPTDLKIVISGVQYMIEWTTAEPDYSTNWVYASNCTPQAIDCGRPTKSVEHWQSFLTKAEAITFINDRLNRPVSMGTNLIMGNGMTWSGVPADYPVTFVGLFEAREVPTALDIAIETVPQPPPPTITRTTKTVRELYQHGSGHPSRTMDEKIDPTPGHILMPSERVIPE